MAVLLVLCLMAVTLAVSYAMLRGQGTTTQLAGNNSRALDARAAARSGISAAIRNISEANWAGVTSTMTANVTNNSWYEVTYTTGDPKLASGDPKYSEYPFRVTIDSIGYAADPTNNAVRSSYKSRAVVQLVRRALASEPANWNTLTGKTVYQWGNRDVTVQFPVRVSGSSTILGHALIAPDYPQYGNARNKYLIDLKTRTTVGGKPDRRPFASPLTIALARQDATNLDRIQVKLGITTLNSTAATTEPLSHPGTVTTYKLYPGGKSYTVPVLQTQYGSTLQNVTLTSDPINNPLGVYRSSGTLSLQNNVSITGTVITDGTNADMRFTGTNVIVQAANLPSLYGSTQIWQLPSALVVDDIRVYSAATGQLKGFAMVWDDFELAQGSSSTTFSFTGNLATNGLILGGRSSWVMTTDDWQNSYDDFNNQHSLLGGILDAVVRALFGLGPSEDLYFPDYMQSTKGFTVAPTLTLQPESNALIKPHWQDWTQPVYVKGNTDLGLIWDVIRWEDGI
jgi:hypothetical protein